jgi:hypothetical protein
MRVFRQGGAWALVGAVLLAGCDDRSGAPPPKVKTGAEQAAKEFFTGLVSKDWAAAYRLLDDGSRTARSGEQFARLAETYYRGLGFEPAEVVIQSCDERAGDAVAHVNLKGGSGASVKYHKDAVSLRRGARGWAVVLPPTFGKPRPGRTGVINGPRN